MKPEELLQLCKRQAEYGLDRLVLTMPSPKFRGAYPSRVRTPFGLCQWYPSANSGRILIYPTLKQVESYMKKAMKAG